MSIRRQRATIRRNAGKSARPSTRSTGPAPSFDTPKHGADAKFQFTESPDLAVLAAEYRKRFNPANALERLLVDTLVSVQPANSGGAFVRLQRTISACERSYHRALKELQRPKPGWGRRFRRPTRLSNRWSNLRNPNIPNPVTGNWLRSGKTRKRRLQPLRLPPPQPLRSSPETPFSSLPPYPGRPPYESNA